MEQYIYLILSKTGTLLSKAITKAGHMEYAHASLSLDPTLNVMYSFGRIYPRFPLLGGFVEENIHQGVFKNFGDTECLVMKIPVSQMQFEKISKELESFKEKKGQYRYNFIGLIGVKVGVPVQREKAYFCSQFVSSVIQKGGVSGIEKNPALTTPNDLKELDRKFIVYEGLASDYPQFA